MNDRQLTRWDWALKAAEVLGTSVCALAIPPPSSSLVGSLLEWPRIVVFVLAIFLLLKSHTVGRQIGVAVALFAFGLLCLVAYFFALSAWSCQLEQGRVVIGQGYTPAGAKYLAENPNSTCVDLLVSFASDPHRVYEGIAIHEVVMGVVYVAMIVTLSMTILFAAGRTPR